ncbi:cytoplasmic protein [Buttiauxella selenatireducens]|uniref:Cytoplasmic protein n=1 Tax=Buttiauxella selenatireducens TaxID=3073902 RepID=A0ABY9S9B0_9ENTR|nr:cytoplasmic protein [Buttiauxella sp. R73]WMY73751.1 cytoplasmic protein [Buttiauxella sp. R73]
MSDVQQPIQHDTATSNDASPENTLLRDNIAALVAIKNENIARFTEGKINITSALVEQKWHNRHQMFPYRMKEEIYGSVLSEILAHQPRMKNVILARLEAVYQQLRNEEAQTLSRTRALLENSYKTPNL